MYVTHFLRQHYLLQVNGYNLSRNLSLSDFGWAPPEYSSCEVKKYSIFIQIKQYFLPYP